MLRQPRGSALLVGVGGTGKRTIARFASFVCGCSVHELKSGKSYGPSEFRDDIKLLYDEAGLEGRRVTFLVNEADIVHEAFLDDINNLLNSGAVPQLYAPDEIEPIVSRMRAEAKRADVGTSREAVWRFFLDRVRANLHIVFCMSPVGESFRKRTVMYPSLVNCCTIVYVADWPRSALTPVARKFLDGARLASASAPAADADRLALAVCEQLVDVHESASTTSVEFFEATGRRVYVTPSAFLSTIRLFLRMLNTRRQELSAQRNKLVTGIRKLEETGKLVAVMREDLTAMQPVLREQSEATSELLTRVAGDQKEADAVKQVVKREEAVVLAQARDIEVLAKDAQADLEQAMPAFHAAVEALESLNKQDINEVRSFANPPALVVLVMEAVCVMKGTTPSWPNAKQLLGESDFLQSLVDYDKNNIPAKRIKQIEKFIDNPSFAVEKIQTVSKAATSICQWIHAIYIYHGIWQVVAPKQAKVDEAERMLAEANEKLAGKRAELTDVEARLAQLTTEYEASVAKKNVLASQIQTTEVKLDRAQRLLDGLGDERVSWMAAVERIDRDEAVVLGTVLLSAAQISYLGPFSADYRKALGGAWLDGVERRRIPIMDAYTLREAVGVPVQIRAWNIQGLPGDDYSVENALIATMGERCALMIGPRRSIKEL